MAGKKFDSAQMKEFFVQRGEYVYDIRDEVFDVTGYLASGVGGP